jgi:hypothetical protein
MAGDRANGFQVEGLATTDRSAHRVLRGVLAYYGATAKLMPVSVVVTRNESKNANHTLQEAYSLRFGARKKIIH